MPYLLDTDTISWSLRPRPNPGVVERLNSIPPDDLFTSAVSLGELVFGARRVGSTALLSRIDGLVDRLTVLPYDQAAARLFGLLRADLELLGTSVDVADLMIAAIALTNRLPLVTGNVRHFSHVPGLIIENWLT